MKFCRITDAPITAGNVGKHSHPVIILCLAKVPFYGLLTVCWRPWPMRKAQRFPMKVDGTGTF